MGQPSGRPFVVTRGTSELSRNIDDYPEGLVMAIDKPYRWTSADVIRKVKYAAIRHFGKKNLKIGHAGTLDPLATGILIVCIGKATKLAQKLMDHDKEYVAGICFGATTPSYDLEKEIDREFPYGHITEGLVREKLEGFVGEQEQVAPLFSAKSIEGVRAYEHARRLYKRQGNIGQAESEMIRTVRINIYELELMDFHTSYESEVLEKEAAGASGRIHVASSSPRLPHADIRLACGKGTYVRAFARDLGEALGSGAHLVSLRRTKNGPFTDAVPLDHILFLLSSPKSEIVANFADGSGEEEPSQQSGPETKRSRNKTEKLNTII